MVNKEKIKKILQIGTLVVGGAFVGTSVVAKIKKENSIYKEDKRQRNLLEGHKVIFVADENDSENADGACGHLESVGLSEYQLQLLLMIQVRFYLHKNVWEKINSILSCINLEV